MSDVLDMSPGRNRVRAAIMSADGLLGAFRAVENFGNRLMHWAVFESAGDVKDMGRQLVHGAADAGKRGRSGGVAGDAARAP